MEPQISGDYTNTAVHWCSSTLDNFTCVPSESDAIVHQSVRLRFVMSGKVDLFAVWWSNRSLSNAS